MFGKKKNSAPLKNQPRGQEEPKEAGRTFSFPKLRIRRKAKAPKKTNKQSIITRIFSRILGEQFLSQDWVARNAPMVFMVFLFIFMAIANNYIAQRKSVHIDNAKKEIKDLRDEYISSKSQLMYSTKMSEIAKKLEARGIKEPVKPALKLIISKKEGEE